MKPDPTKRFSNRVEDYIKFRPTYPDKMILLLQKEVGLNKRQVIADIGSGTGISSQPFLEFGNTVFGVEPNKEMRAAQERLLGRFPNFKSINGSAERTNLENKSIDILFSGQAFHWFDKEKSKAEFSRILKEDGNILLVWNSRNVEFPFQKEYEQILYDTIEDYKNVTQKNIEPEDIEQFFKPKPLNYIALNNFQKFDLESLKGRLRSSSYCPKEGKVYEQLMKKIEELFKKYETGNKVIFSYKTMIYWC